MRETAPVQGLGCVSGRVITRLVADDSVVQQRPARGFEEEDVGGVWNQLGEIGADRICVGPPRRASVDSECSAVWIAGLMNQRRAGDSSSVDVDQRVHLARLR